MNLTTMINAGYLIFAFVFVLAGALIALARGLSKSLMRFASIVVSAALALGSCILIVNLAENVISLELLKKIDLFSQLLEQIPSLSEALKAIVSGAIGITAALVLFVPLFFLFRLLGMIPYFIVKKRVPQFKFKGQRLAAMAVGAVCGAIIAIVITMPLFSTADYASRLVSSAFSPIQNTKDAPKEIVEIIDTYNEYIDPIKETVPIKVTVALGGRQIFDTASTVVYKGRTSSLSKELLAASETVGKGAAIVFDQDDKQKALDFIDSMDSISSLSFIPDVIADGINGICEYHNETGKNPSASKEGINRLADTAANVFASSDRQTLKEDLHTVCDVARILVENDAVTVISGIVREGLEGIDVRSYLAKDGLVNSIIEVLNKNPRFSKLATDVKNIFISTMVEKLDIPDVGDTEYKDMIDDITSFVSDETKTLEEKEEIVKETINEKLKEENIEISPEITEFLSEAIVREFNGKTEITNDDIQKFIASGAFDSISFEDIEEFIK